MPTKASSRVQTIRYRQEVQHLLCEIEAAVSACFQLLDDEAAASQERESVSHCVEYLLNMRHGLVAEENHGTAGAVRVFDALAAAAGLLRDFAATKDRKQLHLAWMFVGAAAGRAEAVQARRQVAQKAGAGVSTKRRSSRAAKVRAHLALHPQASVAELLELVPLDESSIRKIKRLHLQQRAA